MRIGYNTELRENPRGVGARVHILLYFCGYGEDMTHEAYMYAVVYNMLYVQGRVNLRALPYAPSLAGNYLPSWLYCTAQEDAPVQSSVDNCR